MSKHVFGFVGGQERLWEGCSMFSYVLGILYGVAMLYGLISETYRGIPLDEESVVCRKEYLKKWEGVVLLHLQCFLCKVALQLNSLKKIQKQKIDKYW